MSEQPTNKPAAAAAPEVLPVEQVQEPIATATAEVPAVENSTATEQSAPESDAKSAAAEPDVAEPTSAVAPVDDKQEQTKEAKPEEPAAPAQPAFLASN